MCSFSIGSHSAMEEEAGWVRPQDYQRFGIPVKPAPVTLLPAFCTGWVSTHLCHSLDHSSDTHRQCLVGCCVSSSHQRELPSSYLVTERSGMMLSDTISHTIILHLFWKDIGLSSNSRECELRSFLLSQPNKYTGTYHPCLFAWYGKIWN